MKTIYTTLPIYDRIDKQLYRRARGTGQDKPTPITCPRHRLPSFEWNAESDNMGDISNIELVGTDGDTFNVPTPFTGWTNVGWDVSWSSNGLDFTASETAAHIALCAIDEVYYGFTGEIIKFHCDATINTGDLELRVLENAVLVATYNIVDGVNDIEHTLTGDCGYVGGGLMFIIASELAAAQSVVIENVKIALNSLNKYFPTLTNDAVIGSDTYYYYNGDTLNYPLPEGLYYLRITMENGHILYSEWFLVSCVFKNLITEWTNDGYNNFDSLDATIVYAGETGVDGDAYSDSFDLILGEQVMVIFNITELWGDPPTVSLQDTDHATTDSEVAAAGLNVITLEASVAGDHEIHFSNETAGTWTCTEILVIRNCSPDYLIIDFSNTCDIGDIIYQDGLTQTIWLKSEPMETSFPQEEQGANDGNGRFVRSYARQVKKYIVRTPQMPDYMVEVFNRMKLHDTVEITNLIGDTNDVYNLEVDHEWLYDDKYYAQINLTFDHNEAFVIAGCCNNVT